MMNPNDARPRTVVYILDTEALPGGFEGESLEATTIIVVAPALAFGLHAGKRRVGQHDPLFGIVIHASTECCQRGHQSRD